VALVLTKSSASRERYQRVVFEGLSAEEGARIAILSPEELPDFMASFEPPSGPSETIVKGYRVRVSHTAIEPAEANERRDHLAKLVAKTLRRSGKS
jgi:hypothetical protein